ncbi:guanine-specific ribonuclease N1 and T1 [Flexivirga sp. ID2601S]|uniref:Guanine-specific ribonuclease N1 and T1 n=1 Tax=Flexivirga aerilata TaxID=1656889 RepID=A0A849AI33_9MICO|nr:ribonuclease domain-containing protein [Flexivirga aerilata]NNG40105.1 guanine-specific ribonuclease N1 and T1 [Flexivirga aerilata]
MFQRAKQIRDGFIPAVFGLLVLITLLCVLAGCFGSTSGSDASSSHGTLPATASDSGRRDGLPTVRAGDLPREARATMALIAQGGPYPYGQDGAVFGNRERILPREPSGYYREYTVVTPGSKDRGARRIIAGKDGTLYYTSDHYDSFRRIVQ